MVTKSILLKDALSQTWDKLLVCWGKVIFCDLTLIFWYNLAVLFWYKMLLTTYNQRRPRHAPLLLLDGGCGLLGKRILSLNVDVAGFSWIKSWNFCVYSDISPNLNLIYAWCFSWYSLVQSQKGKHQNNG